MLVVPCPTQVANECSSSLDLPFLFCIAPKQRLLSDNPDLVSKKAGNSIPSTVTIKNGAYEGIKGWIRPTDGSNTPCFGVRPPGSKVILAVHCLLPGFMVSALQVYPFTCCVCSVSFDRV